jgi:antirestriction protein
MLLFNADTSTRTLTLYAYPDGESAGDDTAILVIDIQNDFCSHESFPVKTWGHDVSHMEKMVEKMVESSIQIKSIEKAAEHKVEKMFEHRNASATFTSTANNEIERDLYKDSFRCNVENGSKINQLGNNGWDGQEGMFL